MTPAWLLPEFVEDILPPHAAQAEALRRRLIDLFGTYGYDFVCPPLIEYLDSLLTGSARDLDLKTFKVVDGLSGRQMGIRADMTPQAARIDAHLLNRQGVTRLCYAGPVLHTKPAGSLSSREPYQIGAELFGHAGLEADVEILELLLAALKTSGLQGVRISLGHVGIFRELAGAAGLSSEAEHAMFRALRAKDVPTVHVMSEPLSANWRAAFRLLPELYGDAETVGRARAELPALPGIQAALDELAALVAVDGGAGLSVDLADLRGYGYHTGSMFAVYVGGQAQAVALGGRYNGAGATFGRSRPATGFSLDLRRVLECLPVPVPVLGVLAPVDADPMLKTQIAELRARGERVVVDFGGQGANRSELQCNRQLQRVEGGWKVLPL